MEISCADFLCPEAKEIGQRRIDLNIAIEMGRGINSVDADYRAGSNIGIIADPLTANARLIAATRPIFGAAFNGVARSGDGKVLFGVEQISGSVFAVDVEQIVKTIEHPEKFAIDQKGRGTGYPNLADRPTLFDPGTLPFFPLPLPFGLPTGTAVEPTTVKITDLEN